MGDAADLARAARPAARGRPTSTRDDTAWVMDQVLAGDATPAQLAGFLVALRAKGETAAEITGLAEAMLRAHPPGGGGRAARSTSSAPAATTRTPSTSRRWRPSWSPAAGVPVVKHGNRAATSACGAADVLEGLGVAHLPAARRRSPPASREVGIGFCFAPVFHPSMRHTVGAAPRAGHPDGDQRARPADQPGPARRGPDRLRRRAAGAGDGRGVRGPRRVGAACCAATTASTS